MCVPNPPLYSKPSEGDNSKPATYLIRVKTAEDADELFSQLNKSKSSSNWYFYSKLDGSEKTEKFTVWLKGSEIFSNSMVVKGESGQSEPLHPAK